MRKFLGWFDSGLTVGFVCFLFFLFSGHFDVMQCRSLQFRHFLWQWGSINNYWGQPITMGLVSRASSSRSGRR